jgi:hypothetical protein
MYNFCECIIFVVLKHHQTRGIKLQVTSVLRTIAIVLLYPQLPVILQGLMFWNITTRLVSTECFSILRLGDKQLFGTLHSDSVL